MNFINRTYLLTVNPGLVLVLGTVAVSSCQKTNSENVLKFNGNDLNGLRPMNQSEAQSDFAQMANYFRAYYGPMEYKEKRFNFSFDNWVSEIESQLKTAHTDEEILGLYAKFISRFQDGHVGINFPINSQ